MSGDPVPVSIEILDKEYMVSCPPAEREALMRSAALLDERMRQVRDSGKVLGTERMAVITALNLVHELRQQRDVLDAATQGLDEDIKRISDKLRAAVGRRFDGVEVD